MSFQTQISDDPQTLLVAERLRDGRIALGTRVRRADGEWEAGELLFLPVSAQLALAAWLAPLVESNWADTVRQRQADPLRTAGELYGEGPSALRQLALDTIEEMPPDLLARAMILLANSIGPDARERLVERINETDDRSEEMELRRRMADENQTFAYAISAAALFDALSRGMIPEDAGND